MPPDWQANSHASLNAFKQAYLTGNTRVADTNSRAPRGDREHRPPGTRGARRTGALRRAHGEPRVRRLPGIPEAAADAGPEELAYADFLAGRAARAAAEEPLSRLVSLGVQFKSAKATPESIATAIEISSAQGWRRPLLAWLGVQEKRAEAAGDREALERIRRRIALVAGKG